MVDHVDRITSAADDSGLRKDESPAQVSRLLMLAQIVLLLPDEQFSRLADPFPVWVALRLCITEGNPCLLGTRCSIVPGILRMLNQCLSIYVQKTFSRT
ncbi:hypothetical protein KC351_g81 [Hortaea werneckii]|nr:hypothetical protein KC351_g81 [Hortaea werneckii]